MDSFDVEQALGSELSSALARKGYTELTPVQRAVLDPALAGSDLRISSQTGSGKTLAIGFVLRDIVRDAPSAPTQVARPCALVIAPTRELAQQTQAELQWLYAECDTAVVAITGGASYRDEHRALARKARLVVVGTPGRLIDHLDRGSIELGAAGAVVLDEADRLLDMGFREELDRILAHATGEHRTHLVSATFARDVRALADRVQPSAQKVEGTSQGEANADIDHVLHVVDPRDRLAAIVNLLLAEPEQQSVIFVRMRAEAASLADELVAAGLGAAALSGELDQAARNRTLSAFRDGRKQALVATDVAARGIDIPSVRRVIHAEPPTSAIAYTHRAGRTGRAGRKGISSLLITPAQVVPVTRLLRGANIPHRFDPVPSAQLLRDRIDERIYEALTSESEEAVGDRAIALARRLLAGAEVEGVLARLLARTQFSTGAQPREMRSVPLPAERGRPRPAHPLPRGQKRPEGSRFGGDHAPREPMRGQPFRVTWGAQQGADPRRLLAIVCRRGRIRGSDVGAIRIEDDHSIVEIAPRAAATFATHASRPDPRDRHVRIHPEQSGPHPRAKRLPPSPPHESAPPARPARDGRKPPKRRRKA